ncbi:ABC transporter ATP-binding protein [Leuconostoc falkenbergense]|jgi:ABC-2 type transport system ATP-binding protein|uniref:ABC transporter ATP-binding protein n=1 Tax=Leuconostoc TaxID=1243 RepID=UPI000E09A88D|nr:MULTISPECIES: ABC transporter ATP-binding protein [Leuconostoc]RDG17819.1 multidrug ABC transporter ATP-binding protein [Leuconostoc pseudomesenteroides]MCT4390184.1 ABC transporter ATP-binding protein [Leuconostoc falkenbergense]MCT4411443.1 ABC transporter ATP-binding protein [Leuconostoc falkenbergense]MDV3545015.1 ABC transporter ATP-binding protein [Leuconostoc falkenbergense]MDY5164613.1 ABC transporter ATP-binding protein [Leuconostoc falkenbergense]
MIVIEQATKKIGRNTVLKDVNLNFKEGTIYGLRGRNGAGKTMLLRAIAGLIKLDSGRILVNNQQIRKEISFPKSLGILIENNNVLPDFTLKKNLQLLAKIKKIATDEMIDDAILRVGLNPNDKRKVRQFSLGMKQRAAIAQAIFEKPDLILLDEPTNAIDVEGVREMRKIFELEKKRGASIILASHNPEDLNVLADEIIVMAEGRVVNEK